MDDKYRWHYLKDEKETEREPEIVGFSQSHNFSEAVLVTDGYGIYDVAMLVENHVEGDCNKVYEKFWHFGPGKWEGFDHILAWKHIEPFEPAEMEDENENQSNA